jgi:nucleoside-diphosphate-sugar epimerase
MSGRKVLVAGASGLVGGAAVERFLEAEEAWDAVALSRRRPEIRSDRPYAHVPVGLRDRNACASALGQLEGVTHVVYAALYEKPGLVPGWQDPDYLQINTEMLHNLIESLTSSRDTIEHVSILQGTKAYGFHLGPMAIPARERMPRHPRANFYWEHEDYIRELAAERGWRWTVLGPISSRVERWAWR